MISPNFHMNPTRWELLLGVKQQQHREVNLFRSRNSFCKANLQIQQADPRAHHAWRHPQAARWRSSHTSSGKGKYCLYFCIMYQSQNDFLLNHSFQPLFPNQYRLFLETSTLCLLIMIRSQGLVNESSVIWKAMNMEPEDTDYQLCDLRQVTSPGLTFFMCQPGQNNN